MMRPLLALVLAASTAQAIELPSAKPERGTIHRW